MCGIAGYISSYVGGPSTETLRRMNDVIAHRGPDDEGYYESITADQRWRVALAHRRLSIIDLSTGHQPVGNEDGRIQIVFNGEIYNFQELRDELIACGHQFRTKSDTETIVHAYEQWGTDCLQRFRGMFAFALWDGVTERLLLARDRFGKKPLFMIKNDAFLAFGSEVKSLLELPNMRPSVDAYALAEYFMYRYVPGPRTLFAGIRKLMPGSYAVWQRGKLKEERYYLPPDGELRKTNAPSDDVVGSFLSELDEAIRIRMVSDVPFGAFLSGGIDSSAVVGLMARHSSLPVKTFSVGFAESAYSELGYARTIAAQFRTDHHELTVSQDHLMQELPALVRFRDAPVAEPSDIPIFLLSKEARRSVKMVLTGEGADELLGGYPKHVWEGYAAAYQRTPRLLRSGLIEPLIGLLPYAFRRAKTAVVNLGLEDHFERMPRWFGALSRKEYSRLIAAPTPPVDEHAVQFAFAAGNTALRSILFFDQTSWLPDNLLERGDRMTMAASLEGRMPFMDHELAAFVSALPDEWRVKGSITKRILREAMRRILPASILQRPKVGFRVPVNEWFQGSMREYLYDHLAGPASRTRDYYRRETLKQVLDEHARGRQNHEKLLWCLLNLEIWHREYRISA